MFITAALLVGSTLGAGNVEVPRATRPEALGEEDFGPRELRKKAKPAQKKAAKIRAQSLAEAREWIETNRAARSGSIAAFAAEVARWMPGGEALAADATGAGELAGDERGELARLSRALVESAQVLDGAGLGGAAGFEAYRALGLDPGNEAAGELLGYAAAEGAQRHPRWTALRAEGKVETPFGWLPATLATGWKEGLAPSEGRWVALAEANAAHASWASAHELWTPFVHVRTTAAVEEIAPWIGRMDGALLWMRARFARVPGFVEPRWPIEVRIYRDAAECKAQGEPPPEFACWLPRDQHVLVIASAFVPGRTMPMENVVQHELAHGFLDLAFPADPDGSVVSGWMTEAFEQWVYYASNEHPNDTRFWSKELRPYAPALDALAKGEDVLGKLSSMSYADVRTSPLAMVAPILADYCAADELRWEGFARFTAAYKSYREPRGTLENLLGPANKLSDALADWAKATGRR